jgi:hypothetical protein
MPRTLTLDAQRERARAWAHFVEANGRQPGNKPEAGQAESALYYWIHTLRQAEIRASLDPAIRFVLDEVAPTWREPNNPSRPSPELHAAHAIDYREFTEELGRAPSQVARSARERRLQHWMTNQRATLAAGRLAPEVQAAISAELPGWDAPSGRGRRDHSEAVPFAERIVALSEYMATHHGMFPPANGLTETDVPLGRWLAHQRRQWRRGELKRSRKRALDGLSPSWTYERRSDGKWRIRLSELAAFVADEGRLPRRTKNGAERGLSAWLHNMRHTDLTDEQIGSLDAAVPNWRGSEVGDQWTARAFAIQTFIAEHGHRPRAQSDSAEESRMGFWLTRQRRALREGKQAEAQTQLLNEVLPGWELPERRIARLREPRVPGPAREPRPIRELASARLPTNRRGLIDRAQRDVTNRHPELALDDPWRFARKVVNRYLKLAERAGPSPTTSDSADSKI